MKGDYEAFISVHSGVIVAHGTLFFFFFYSFVNF